MLEFTDWLFEYYFVEIKVYNNDDAEQQTLDAINTVRELKLEDKVIFISYNETAKYILWSQKDIISWRDTFDTDDINKIWNTTHKYFLLPYDKITSEIVEKAKEMWKEIVTYTVNTTWDLQKLKDLDINIIMTDNIKLLREYNK
jgi:glycerophosphoryl diester phosphodiesterase